MGLTKILFVMNAGINPFIYAWTIPAFKTIVRDYFVHLKNCQCLTKNSNNTSMPMVRSTTSANDFKI